MGLASKNANLGFILVSVAFPVVGYGQFVLVYPCLFPATGLDHV